MQLVDSKACNNVRKLFSYISNQNEGIMFGHQDTLSYGIGWKYKDQSGESDVKKVCGDYPAVFGWDLGHIETGSSINIDGVDFDVMRQNIKKAHGLGGVNTISWHPVNPITGGNTWDVTMRVVSEILPGGEYEQKFTQWLRVVAEFLLSLEDENGELIPIVFRPFHEHTGSWFWWGDDLCTQQEFVDLWHFTVNFLRETMGCHNLLYCYSSDKVTSEEQYVLKYPGDEWVDILGIDVYDFPHQGVDYFKVMPECLTILKKVGEKLQKPYALTETGNLCVAPEKWWTESLLPMVKGYGIKWMLVWINIEEKQYYGPHPGNKSAQDFVSFYNNENTIFLSQLPKIFE